MKQDDALRIYLVRHSLTEWNKQKRAQGWLDSPLAEEGKAVAGMLGEKLKEKKIARIFTSDLGRAVETSTIINQQLQVQLTQTPALREQNLGIFNGRPSAEQGGRFDENPELAPPQGESMNHVRKRVLGFIAGMQEDGCLIVTHGGAVQNILSEARNVPITAHEARMKQNEIIILERTIREGKMRLKVTDVEEA
jgi:broad specificity phosphatase PhoE